MTYNISVDINNKQNLINPLLYGSFAEHLGKCIYGGIWVGENSSIKNERGFRIDVLDCLKEIELPVIRWPGGCFADTYHWIDGVGPKNKRPRRYNLWWKQPESNAFGTDEFMQLCHLLNSEPYMAINVGSGSVQEALNWIEYCNSSKNTEFAELRVKNGHPKPYNVKYWGIGNENWGCGGAMSPEYYADLYRRFATYIRQQTDSNVKLIACGSNTDFDDWDERVLKNIQTKYFDLIDFISLHVYTGWNIEQNNLSEQDYYKIIKDISITKNKIEKAIQLCNIYSKNKNIKVILDEWGLWYKEATVNNGLFQEGLLLDAIFAALNFHLLHNYSDDLFMTNLAQAVNVLQSFILTRGNNIVRTPTYYLYKMYKPHRGKRVVKLNSNLPKIKLTDDDYVNALSISGSISEDNKEIFITIVNIDLEKDYYINLNSFPNYSLIDAFVLTANDFRERNNFFSPNTIMLVKREKNDLKDILIKKHSVNSFLFKKI